MKLTNATSLTYTGTSISGWFRQESESGCSVDDVIVEYVYTNASMGVPFHVWSANDWTIQYSYFDENGNGNDDNFHREWWSAVNNDRWVIRWNYLKGINNTGIIGYVNDGDAADAVEFYGNIVAYETGDQSGAAFLQSDVNLTNWRIFNNTIVGWQDAGAPIMVTGAISWTGTVARNNILAHHVVEYGDTFNVGGGTMSHGGYYDIVRTGTGDVTASYAAESTNAQTFGSSPFVDFAGADYRLTAATTAGSSTSSPAGNAVDMFGCTRGGDGTLDRGALEYGC
jgi:hypothetical protein